MQWQATYTFAASIICTDPDDCLSRHGRYMDDSNQQQPFAVAFEWVASLHRDVEGKTNEKEVFLHQPTSCWLEMTHCLLKSVSCCGKITSLKAGHIHISLHR